MSDHDIKLQKNKTDKIIKIIELYLGYLKEYREDLDDDFMKLLDSSECLYLSDSIIGKLKHLGVVSRREMIDFEKTVETHFYRNE